MVVIQQGEFKVPAWCVRIGRDARRVSRPVFADEPRRHVVLMSRDRFAEYLAVMDSCPDNPPKSRVIEPGWSMLCGLPVVVAPSLRPGTAVVARIADLCKPQHPK